MACPCCQTPFCCSSGPPASVTIRLYSPVVVSSSTPGYDPITPILGTYVLSRDTATEAAIGVDGTTLSVYGVYPAGKTWADALAITTSQWKDVPTGDVYMIANVSCSGGSSVSLAGLSLIAKAIPNTSALISGVVWTTAYRTSFNITSAAVTASCGSTTLGSEYTQTHQHVEIYYRAGTYNSTSGAYFDSSKIKASIEF